MSFCSRALLSALIFWSGFSIAQPMAEELNRHTHDQIRIWGVVFHHYEPIERSDAAMLVFLGGYYPYVGLAGYETLLGRLADGGVPVLAVDYLPDDRTPLVGALRTAFVSSIFSYIGGFDSLKCAGLFEWLFVRLREQKPSWFDDRPMVLYGHSAGARIAASWVNLELQENRSTEFTAVILDGLTPQKFGLRDGHRLCSDQEPDEVPRIGTRSGWPVLTVLRYARDGVAEETSRRAFECLGVEGRQFLQINDFAVTGCLDGRADHFSPFSDDVSCKGTLRGAGRRLTDQAAASLHGYPIRIGWDLIDADTGALSLLTNFAQAHSARDSDLRREARSIFYGEHRTYLLQDHTLREVLAEGGELPKE